MYFTFYIDIRLLPANKGLLTVALNNATVVRKGSTDMGRLDVNRP